MENRFTKNISWSMVDGITCLPAGRAVSLVFGLRLIAVGFVNGKWFLVYCKCTTYNP